MSPPLPGRLPPSGLTVVVVGAGFGGLSAALECHRKGHTVVLLEKVDDLRPLGDLISFGPNAARVFDQWGTVVPDIQHLLYQSPGINYHHYAGRFVTRQNWTTELSEYGRSISGHRGVLHLKLIDYAREVGIDLRLGHRVVDYYETADAAGVVLADGSRIAADLVVCAEGVKSPGRKAVLGYEDAPRASGYAVYRAWYDGARLADNPLTKHLVDGDTHTGWIGVDKHLLATSLRGGADYSWVLTHQDTADIDESWQFPGRVEDVLRDLEGWDPVARALVAATPPDCLVDYKLVFRDPLPTFVSPAARILLIGDAAHPFLPTSVQGASQAIEDGATIAACLDKLVIAAGSGPAAARRVPEAVRAYEAIRYGRVHRAQRMGVTTREQWHKADWDAIWKDPESLHLRREAWLLDFDPEQHVYDVYDETVARLAAAAAAPAPADVPEKDVVAASVTPLATADVAA